MNPNVMRKDIRLTLWAAVVACVALAAIFFARWLGEKQVLFPDFFGLWTFGSFVLTHSPSSIYDNAELYSLQASLGMPVQLGAFPFPYPPWILLLLAPFGAMPYFIAKTLWLFVTFAAYALSIGLCRWPLLPTILLVFAPSSIICFIVGQNGFLTAALMLGGLRLLQSRPLIAGSLLAALAYKPQMAILIPFVLIFGLHWRALISALCTALILTLATIYAFGVDIWLAWLQNVLGQVSTVAAARRDLLDMMPTLTASALLLGIPTALTYLIQITGIVVSIAAAWAVRKRSDTAALAVIPLGTVAATPYIFHYDLPAVTGAVLMVIVFRSGSTARVRQLPALLGCVLLPALQVTRAGMLGVLVPATLLITLCSVAFSEAES